MGPLPRVKGAGHAAGSDVLPAINAVKSSGCARSGSGTAAQQCLGVRMGRPCEQHITGRHFDDATGTHHGDSLADVFHDGQIMRDEQVSQAEFGLQVLEQVQDLRLNRDVQRRHRLVTDQHLGAERERARDSDALPLATGEAVRIAAQVTYVETYRSQEGLDPLDPLFLARDSMDRQRLCHDVVHRHPRIEGVERVLEDVLQPRPKALELRPFQGEHIDCAISCVEGDGTFIRR